MRYRVLNTLKARGVLTTALLLAAGVTSGCSGDAIRLDDGFYTGALPQPASQQIAAVNQGYGTNLDGTMTGSIASAQGSAGYPASGQAMAAQQPQYVPSAPAADVQRGQLPPPPAPNYQPAQPSTVFAANGSASSPVAQSSGPGAQPTTLGAQAQAISNAAPQPAAGANTTVTVASGDTLSAIARRSGVSADAIRQANGMSGDTVRLGQKLVVPTSRPNAASQQVAAVDSAPKPYVKPTTSPATTTASAAPTAPAAATSVASAESKPAPAAAQPAAATETRVATAEPKSTVAAKSGPSSETAPESSGISSYRWPVQGRVLQRFGEKVGSKRNDGLNISVPRGTPVKAAENGVVIYAGDGLKEFGNTVLVKHDDGLVTVYGHADALKVKRGDTVKRGQEIASSGMSGDTDVPQLHFEVRKNSSPIDPSSYLQ
ncbi:peptidoglycan DD-metalloendopeptidase family protein [Fulvimarina sp. 2208YS6-2-32]|uniref:Peptidoglycan DD-metalloendopeptidase family protein n=1 Tax=Fulvimarina uroteuthidis TaxID=3098149 RepID=A0ABU5I5E5_9HYPH|nr:peptidoglycan DD-metalloendopeptidase family protein [Fulvimarina sp. 2208YS6-2-32]MDY8110597.1 peptidoglycan DD-metalloendopeptidase family protein [Fulvimarina sp. 2208YS6-2-32]